MPLPAGARFGPYDVVAQIGAGGMGEVYRARDTRLRRDAAIKVLPALVAADPERLLRFEREAQALAALSHPNIATIYGLEETADGVRGLVMELVEGPTLAERIARGAVPWPEALRLARQIADALEAAHEKGIVHRDLKPANVKLTPEGDVKILDFGLAKAMDRSGGSDAGPSSVSNSPTLTARATEMGMILGTAAYMSPEQARGKTVDRRADIWAFGCVLYELVTGRRAFGGEEVTDVLARLIERDPDWTALPKDTTPEMQRLLARCLTKDPKARLRDIGEARIQIDDMLAGRTSASITPVATTVPATLPRTPPLWWRLLPWGLAAVLGVAALTLFLRPTTAPVVSGRTVRADLAIPADVEFFGGPSLSANGAKLAFVGVRQGIRQVYVRALDETEVRPVAGTEGTTLLALSPDGSALAFVTVDRWLKRVTFALGIVEPLADGADVFSGPSWTRGGAIVFSRLGRLVVHPTDGSAERELASADKAAGEVWLSWPVVVGPTVLFASRRSGSNGTTFRLEAVPLAGGARHVLVDGAEQVVFASSDRLVYTRGGVLFVVGFDAASASIRGTPARMGESVYVGPTGNAAVSMSDAGTLLLVPPTFFNSRLVWVSREGVERVIPGPARGFQNPRVSPTDARIAFSDAGTIWTLDPARGTFTRVSGGNEPTVGFPTWSQDGKRIYYRSAEGIRLRSADGEGVTTLLPNTGTSDYPSSLSPDGKTLVLLRITSETGGDLYSTPADGGELAPLLVTKAYEGGPQVSPDGRWLLYVSNESGRMEIYLRPLGGPDRKWPVSGDGGLHPLWSRDGRRVFYRSGQDFLEVDVTTSPDVRLSTPRRLFTRRYEFGANLTFPNFSLSSDGREFLMVQGEPGSRHLNLAINWLANAGR